MTIRASLSLLAFLALGCAPSVAPVSVDAIDRDESRYRLVFDQSNSMVASSEATARMGLAIERALATRGLLRAAEWEEAAFTVRFAMVDLVGDPAMSPASSSRFDSRAWDRAGQYDCTAERCSMAYWSPLVTASVPAASSAAALAIRMETADASRELWTGSHVEPTTWSRVGQRRADEIARTLLGSLPATNES